MTSSNPQGPCYRQLPLWRDANRLLVAVENAVRHFGKTPSPPRYHKYTRGSDLRSQAGAIQQVGSTQTPADPSRPAMVRGVREHLHQGWQEEAAAVGRAVAGITHRL